MYLDKMKYTSIYFDGVPWKRLGKESACGAAFLFRDGKIAFYDGKYIYEIKNEFYFEDPKSGEMFISHPYNWE